MKRYVVSCSTLCRRVITSLCLPIICLIPNDSTAKENFVIGGNVSPPIPPFSWVDDCSGTFNGLNYHLLEMFFSQQGYDLSFTPPVRMVEAPWNDLIDDLRTDDIQALQGVFKNFKAKDLTTAAVPHVSIPESVVFNKNRIEPPYSIEKFTQYVGLLPYAGSDFEKLPTYKKAKSLGLTIKPVETNVKGMKLVANGEADFMIHSYFYSKALSKELNIDHLLGYYKLNIKPLEFYLAVLKGSKWEFILDDWDNFLIKQKESGYLQLLADSYLKQWINRGRCSDKNAVMSENLRYFSNNVGSDY